ncbi:MAG: DUF3391 domain-containing protein [Pseudomonadales bacterium]|nr:DUF3391 domain-containing protein [Pseudomonadales bacterium]
MAMDAQPKYKGLQKLEPQHLTVGMYIAQLDRDWAETDFALQGFYVRTQQAIERLAAKHSFVYVDPRRYDSKMGEVKLHAVGKRNGKSPSRGKLSARERLQPKKPRIYDDSVTTAEEFVTAETTLEQAEQVLQDCVVKLQSNGGFDVDAIEAAITPLVESVMRNHTALAALARMRKTDDYLYSHAISCSVWGAVIGRQLGLPPKDINALATTCAVMDIGKTKIPIELLNAPREPSEDEWEALRGHVNTSVEILSEQGLNDHRVLTAIQTHHERHDGSGYPEGLAGNKIPAFGRIAGLVDTYDAMISDRPYAEALSSYQAIQEIHRGADTLFQAELVEFFIKAIGVFPVGSIVELNTGEVGVVVSQSANNRLKPKVMLILEADKSKRAHLVVIDLSIQQTDTSQPLQWWITKELPVNAYGIDPQEYFLA